MKISGHKQASKTSNDMQRIKNIIELSAMFINLPVDKIDDEIQKRLKLIGEFWVFDQIILAELSDDDKEFKTVHTYTAPGIRNAPSSLNTEQFPWLMKKIARGESVALSSLPEDLPEAAEEDRAFCIKGGIKSSVVLPLKVGEIIRGAFFLVTLRKECVLNDDLLSELDYIGEILAAAIDRKKATEKIDEIQNFDQLLCTTSATYINMLPKHLDKAMRKDLGRLAKLLDANRCIIYLAHDEAKYFRPYLHSGWWPDEDNDFVMQRDKWLQEHPESFFELEYLFDKWRRGEVVQWTQLDKLNPAGEKMKKAHSRFGTKSHLSIPMLVAGSIVGAITIGHTKLYRTWPEELIPRLRLFGEIFANALTRKKSEESLQKALSEVKQLKERIEADYVYLREEIKLEHNFEEIIGQSKSLKSILLKVQKVAPTEMAVLIQGETGTGKELIARAIHNASGRSDRPLIKVNCSALTPSLIESELFGHEKGAFTGAGARRVGRFELANQATLFLDEIGELPLELQPKLLRVLQDGEYERVGGSHTLRTDVRLLAATNRDLEKEVEKGTFRRDLWYRMNTFPILIPPLRERAEDISLLVSWFVKKHAGKTGKRFEMVSQKIIGKLQEYHWPGNIRELEHMIERAIITSSEGSLAIEVPDSPHVHYVNQKLQGINREYIVKALKDSNWIIQGPNGAAKLLGLKPSTLRNRMKRLGIERPVSKTIFLSSKE